MRLQEEGEEAQGVEAQAAEGGGEGRCGGDGEALDEGDADQDEGEKPAGEESLHDGPSPVRAEGEKIDETGGGEGSGDEIGQRPIGSAGECAAIAKAQVRAGPRVQKWRVPCMTGWNEAGACL